MQSPSSTDPKIYNVYINPNVTGYSDDKIILSFDIMSFDSSDDTMSWIYLKSVEIEEIVLSD
jgi:hypothetical protein